MKYIEFDQSRPMDLVLLGRVAIDFNPAYNDQVKEEFKPLKKVHMFEKFVGGSPANIAVGVTRHGLKAGFLGKVSDDQFGDFVTEYFQEQGIDTSHITRCKNGEKLGLTFTEMLSSKESNILMYRNCIADLQLHVDDIDEDYIRRTKAILISGTALAESPSREAAIKAVMLAKKNQTKVIFDIDYRAYNWKNSDEISIYYSIVAKEADIIVSTMKSMGTGVDILGLRAIINTESYKSKIVTEQALGRLRRPADGSTCIYCELVDKAFSTIRTQQKAREKVLRNIVGKILYLKN